MTQSYDLGSPESSATTNCFLRLIQNHYTISVKKKSEDEIRNEKWLIPNTVLFNRWYCLPAAFIIQFCCGSLYAWSVFNKPIDHLMYGEDTTLNVAPITFYIAIGCYGSAAAIMGPWLEKHGPKTACLVGASLFFLGNLVTALALYLKLMWLVFIGYGCICGPGLGICYISPVSALQKWFPDMRGLGAGFATCGFGAGSIAIAKIQIPLMKSTGLPFTFIILGVCFLFLMATSAFVLRTPPPDFLIPEKSDEIKKSPELDVANAEEMSLIEALSSREFRIILVMFVGDIVFGLVLASRLSNIVIDVFGKSPEDAATVVSVNGGVNFIGRLSFSIFSDYIGRKNCFVILLTSQVIVLGCFSLMTTAGAFEAFWVSMCLVTISYGAAFGVIPAYLTDKFGPSNIGACHGIIIAVWAASGVISGFAFTLVYNGLIGSGYKPTDPIVYNINAWWLFGIACIGWLAVHFAPRTQIDNEFNSKLKSFLLCKNSPNQS